MILPFASSFFWWLSITSEKMFLSSSLVKVLTVLRHGKDWKPNSEQNRIWCSEYAVKGSCLCQTPQ